MVHGVRLGLRLGGLRLCDGLGVRRGGLFVLGGTALFGVLYQNVSAVAAFATGGGLALLAAIAVAAQKPVAASTV